MQPFWPVAGFFLLQLVLTFVSAFLNCCSKVKGKHSSTASDELGTSTIVKQLEQETRRRRSRIFCWLVYDVVAVGIICAVVILAVVSQPLYGSSEGSNSTFVVSSSNPLFTPEQHIPRDLAEVLYWCRVLYGWLCAPWMLLLLPGMFPLLTHTKATGYNRMGKTVPMASAMVRLKNYQHLQEAGSGGGGGSANPMVAETKTGGSGGGSGGGGSGGGSGGGDGQHKKKKSSNNPFAK